MKLQSVACKKDATLAFCSESCSAPKHVSLISAFMAHDISTISEPTPLSYQSSKAMSEWLYQ